MAEPELRTATAGQTITVNGAVVYTLAPGDTLVQLPGTDVLYRVPAGPAATPTPTPTPAPTPPPRPDVVVGPTPVPGPKPRTRYGPAVWGKAGDGGGLAGFLIQGSEADRAADRMGVRVDAPKSGVTLSDGSLIGFSNGLTVEHTPAVLKGRLSRWTITGVTFADNFGPALYRGQGAYLAAADDVEFVGCWFACNGRGKDKTVGRGLAVANGFSHGVYVQGGLSQWSMPEGCRRVRFRNCGFVGNAAWGALCKADGCEVVDCLFVGNAYGMLLNGPLPCKAAGNVVIPGPRPCEWYAGQRGGGGGIQWRCASGELSNNLCVLPPECRMPDRNWRAPAFELTLDANAKPNYRGPISCLGSNNAALGWDADVVTRGVPVPGLRTGPCPAADWAGMVKWAEAEARAGTADAIKLIAEARRMAGVN